MTSDKSIGYNSETSGEFSGRPPWDGMFQVERTKHFTRFRKVVNGDWYDCCFLNWEVDMWKNKRRRHESETTS